MPELPELEALAERLQSSVVGRTITGVLVHRPLILRPPASGDDPSAFCAQRAILSASRRGKTVRLALEGGRWIVLNLMLAGTLRRCPQNEALRTRDAVSWLLDDASSLRLHDRTGMAKAYLCDDPDSIPGFDPGPEPFDPSFTAAAFQQALRSFRGEIKGILTRGALVAGIGNAYADEILHAAGIYPFRRSSSLTPPEIGRLYAAIRTVLAQALEDARSRLDDTLELDHDRALAVHNRAGQPCPVCGAPISEVRARGRITSFCRQCQPGTLIKQ
jgi:formamidopyrimidine-DNA glycosylase